VCCMVVGGSKTQDALEMGRTLRCQGRGLRGRGDLSSNLGGGRKIAWLDASGGSLLYVDCLCALPIPIQAASAGPTVLPESYHDWSALFVHLQTCLLATHPLQGDQEADMSHEPG
jgi:hypothetical protein